MPGTAIQVWQSYWWKLYIWQQPHLCRPISFFYIPSKSFSLFFFFVPPRALPVGKLDCRACTRSWSRRRPSRRTGTRPTCRSSSRWRTRGSPPRPPSGGTSWSSSAHRLYSGTHENKTMSFFQRTNISTKNLDIGLQKMLKFSSHYYKSYLHSLLNQTEDILWGKKFLKQLVY